MSRKDEITAEEAQNRLKKKIKHEVEDSPSVSDVTGKTNDSDKEEKSNHDTEGDLFILRLLLSYSATLSSQDEKILRTICRYSRQENVRYISLQPPILFGRSLANTIRTISSNAPVAGSSNAVNGKKRKKKPKINPKSITDDELRAYIWNARCKEPSFKEIFASFDRFKLIQTIYNFPRDLMLNSRKKVKNQLTRGEKDFLFSEVNRSSLLDPRFILVELWHLVSESVVINCQDFIHSKALALVIASLSSNHESIRSLSYSILQRFYRQLESSSTLYMEAPYWLWFIDSIRAYLIVKANHQLSSLLSVFLVCSLDILTDPSNVLFSTIRSFLTENFAKLNSKVVANKLKLLLHSTDVLHFRNHFNFATKVMRFGLINEDDLKALNSHQMFDWVMLLTHSRATTKDEILSLLQIIKSAVSISQFSVNFLCSQCNLLNFILQVTLAHAELKDKEPGEGENIVTQTVNDEEKITEKQDEKKKRKKSKKSKSNENTESIEDKIIHLLVNIVDQMLFHFADHDEHAADEMIDALATSNHSDQVKSILITLQTLRSVIYTSDGAKKNISE